MTFRLCNIDCRDGLPKVRDESVDVTTSVILGTGAAATPGAA